MHKFLRAIGFSGIKTREQLNALLKETVEKKTDMNVVLYDDDTCLGQYSRDFLPDIGLSVCGEIDDMERFSKDFYFPYIRGRQISSNESSYVERHAAQLSFAGVCEDSKVGISIIYYLINRNRYISDSFRSGVEDVTGVTLSLSGLATSGTIMMPLAKNVKQVAKADNSKKKRNRLLEAARNGDEKAIESLTLDDLDIYSSLLRKVKNTDVYTLVDTYFMPYGVECDQYSVLAEITQLEELENPVSGEFIYRMTLNCNEIPIDLCINKGDLFGEPEVGRRFKGNIWLQGYLNYL